MLRAKPTKIEVTRTDIDLLDKLREEQYEALLAKQSEKAAAEEGLAPVTAQPPRDRTKPDAR